MATSISPGAAYSDELSAFDLETGVAYSGAATIYVSLRDTTTEEWWDNTLMSWGAEPSLADMIPTTDPGNGDRRFTIPAEATFGRSLDRLYAKLVTTLVEADEVIVSEKRTYTVASISAGAAERFASGVTVTGQMIADEASNLLNDPGKDRWPADDLLTWINEAQNKAAFLKPDSYTVTVSSALTAGTKQTLPTSAHRLVRAIRNLGAGGNTPGASIEMMSISVMDSAVPDWHSQAYAASEVQAVLVDERVPHSYYVWPPQPDATSQVIELTVQGAPPPLVSLADAITLDDIWEGALLDYVLFRAWGKETTSQTSSARSAEAYSRFMQAVTGRIAVDSQAPQEQAPEGA